MTAFAGVVERADAGGCQRELPVRLDIEFGRELLRWTVKGAALNNSKSV